MKKLINLILFVCFMSAQGLSGAVKPVSVANDDAFNAQVLVKAMIDGLSAVKSINYFTDKIVFECMGYEIVIDLGFVGSGNIFEPLKSVTPKISAVGKGVFNKGNNPMANLAIDIFQNELVKKGRESNPSILKSLINIEISPIHILGIKLFLLFKSLDVNHDSSFFFDEIISLLFRLSLVDDVHLFDKTKKLTDYLPAIAVDSMDDFGLGTTDFLNCIWGVFVENKVVSTELLGSRPVSVNGFAFIREDLAKKVLSDFVNRKKVGETVVFDQVVSDFARVNNYTVVGFGEFMKKNNKELSIESVSANPFENSVIGSKKFYLDKNYVPKSKFEEELVKQVKGLGNTDGVIYIEDPSNSQYWVAQVSYDLDYISTTKGLLLTFIRAFKDYVDFKKSLFKGDDDCSLKYRRDFIANENQKKLLEKFIRSDEGEKIYDSLCREIDLVVNDVETEQLVQGQVEDQKAEIEKLKKLKQDKLSELLRLNNMVVVYDGDNKSKINEKINVVTVLMRQINDQINEKEAKLSEYIKLNGGAAAENDPVIKDKIRLKKLNSLVDKKRQAGEPVDKKVLDAITRLEDKIASSCGNDVLVKKLDEKLDVRTTVAKLFEKYAVDLRKSLKAFNDDLNELDEEDRLVQELLLEETLAMKSAFAARLESQSQKIIDDNQKIKRLDLLRKALTLTSGSATVSPDKAKELSDLENEYGHIIDGKNNEDFVAELMVRSSIFQDFIVDLSKNNLDKVQIIKQRALESFNALFSAASIRDNQIVLKLLPTSIKNMMRVMGFYERL